MLIVGEGGRLGGKGSHERLKFDVTFKGIDRINNCPTACGQARPLLLFLKSFTVQLQKSLARIYVIPKHWYTKVCFRYQIPSYVFINLYNIGDL